METASRSKHALRMVRGTSRSGTAGSRPMSPTGVGTRPTRIGRSPAIKPEASSNGASMAYEYRVTEAEDGTFPVELWSSQGESRQLIYKTRGFQTRELAEAWMVPVQVRSRLMSRVPVWSISSRNAHASTSPILFRLALHCPVLCGFTFVPLGVLRGLSDDAPRGAIPALPPQCSYPSGRGGPPKSQPAQP